MNTQKQQLLLLIDELERKRGLLLTLQTSINPRYKQLKRAFIRFPRQLVINVQFCFRNVS